MGPPKKAAFFRNGRGFLGIGGWRCFARQAEGEGSP